MAIHMSTTLATAGFLPARHNPVEAQRQWCERPAAAVLPARATPRLPQLRACNRAASFSASWRHQRQQQGRLVVSVLSSTSSEPQPLALTSNDEVQTGPAMSLPELSSSSSSIDSESSTSNSSSVDSEGDGSGSGSVQIDLQLPRRSLLVQFTCNICEGRSERLVNPIAWERGLVIAQCQHCDSWHKLADAANLVEEIRYADLEDK